MSAHILDALSRLAARRFGSFADAATQVFDLLESACPDGDLVLGQVDWDEGKCRVIDSRGDSVPRGTVIPLARNVPTNGTAAGELLDSDALEALGPASWVAAPLDAADGSVVGVLLATGPGGEPPSRDLAQLILVARAACRTGGRASRRAPSCAGSPRWRATAPAPTPSPGSRTARRWSGRSSASTS